MKPCQHCAAPIETKAQVCPECQGQQASTIGLSLSLPQKDVNKVARQNEEIDRSFVLGLRIFLMFAATAVSVVFGLATASVVAGASAFFVGFLLLVLVIQIVGFDIS